MKNESKGAAALVLGVGVSNGLHDFLESLSKPDILFPNLTAAVLLAVMNITTAISVAALVFSGALASAFGTGIGLFLLGTLIGGVLIAAGSGHKAVLSGARSGQAPIVASMAAGIVLAIQGQSSQAIEATVVASILVATLFIGVVLYGLGRARLGGLARYIPFPVMGGFFADLGFLLLKGGVFVSLGSLVDSGDLSTFLSANVVMHLAPAVAFAVWFYNSRQENQSLVAHAVFPGCYGSCFLRSGIFERINGGRSRSKWLATFNRYFRIRVFPGLYS